MLFGWFFMTQRSKIMILVTAANGNQGKLLVPKLLAAGLPVRACVQSEQSAHALGDAGVDEIIVGDISEPSTLARAIQGIEKVYHVGPTAHPRERSMGFVLIDAARAEGIKHFVFSSVLHAITTDLVQHEIKRDVEEHLLSSGLEFTILQPSNYMLPLKLLPVFNEGVFRLSWSLDRRQSLVDLGDVTDVALEVLRNTERHASATYELVGNGRYTAHELGTIISRVMKKHIKVEEIDADTYLKAFFGDRDRSELQHQARVLRAITERYSRHDFLGNSNVLTWLLGRQPTTFEQFVQSQYRAFIAASGDSIASANSISRLRSSVTAERNFDMQYRQLGGAVPGVSAVGIGCMVMSGMMYGLADRTESIATLRAALDVGITLLDTGDFYGMGHNETLIGGVLHDLPRDRFVISVKFGVLRDPGGAIRGFDCRPQAAKNFLAYSLQRLGLDYLDIYRPARLDPSVPIEDTVGAIADMVKAGYVRHIGLSEVGSERVRKASAVHPICDLQIEYSLISRGIESGLLATCRGLGVGVTAYGVLAAGLISGHWRKEVARPGDRRGPAFKTVILRRTSRWWMPCAESPQLKGSASPSSRSLGSHRAVPISCLLSGRVAAIN
jgi:aryl-alcohol dehydrogenase-like predicted oxidoreductase/uncharacterized protein YbjT (DUF2867 family)